GPHVIAEAKKRRTRRINAAMRCHAVDDPGHSMFANTVIDRATRIHSVLQLTRLEVIPLFELCKAGLVKIGGAADERRYFFRNDVHHLAARRACRDRSIFWTVDWKP